MKKKVNIFLYAFIISSLLFNFTLCRSISSNKSYPIKLINKNPGFEEGLNHWEAYIAPAIRGSAIIQVMNKTEFTEGDKHVLLKLPKTAINNQEHYIHVGQNLKLNPNKLYEYSIKVKWINTNNYKISNAVVSIWAKNADGTFNGNDVILTDNRPNKTGFKFTPNSNGKTFCYIALLTHPKKFIDTVIIIDDFRIEEIGEREFSIDPRKSKSNLLKNPSFNHDLENWIKTYNNPHNTDGLNQTIIHTGNNKKLRFIFPEGKNSTHLNNTWIGLFQKIKLYAGNSYKISASIHRQYPTGLDYPTILNIYAYKPKTDKSPEAWLGSVDYKFNHSDEHIYTKTINVVETTEYWITIRAFGWGNDGKKFTIDVDDIKLIKQ